MNFEKYEEYSLELDALEINKKNLTDEEVKRYKKLTIIIEKYEDERSK